MADSLIPANIDLDPPLRVYLANIADAARLANATGRRVEIAFEPGSDATSALAPSVNDDTRTVPMQILARINAEPGRSFRVADFVAFGEKKYLNAILFRLAKNGKIARGGRGEFKALAKK